METRSDLPLPPDLDAPRLIVGTGLIQVVIVTEPFVLRTFKGYAPAVNVRHERQRTLHTLYIGAKSIADQLEPMREGNKGRFVGLEFAIRKESDDQYAKYVITRE